MQVFHITLENGDSDFGATYQDVKITIDGKLSWGADDIQEFKEIIAAYFDCPLSRILTPEELTKEAEELNKYLDEELKKLEQ